MKFYPLSDIEKQPIDWLCCFIYIFIVCFWLFLLSVLVCMEKLGGLVACGLVCCSLLHRFRNKILSIVELRMPTKCPFWCAFASLLLSWWHDGSKNLKCWNNSRRLSLVTKWRSSSVQASILWTEWTISHTHQSFVTSEKFQIKCESPSVNGECQFQIYN